MKTKSNGDILTSSGFINFLQPRQKSYFPWGLHSTEVAFLLLTQRSQVLILAFPIISLMLLLFINLRWLGKSRWRLENADQTYLVLEKVFFSLAQILNHI